MNTRASIIFPYSGNNDDVRRHLMELIETVLDNPKGLHTSTQKPVLVVNKDTIAKGLYESFNNYLKEHNRDYLLDRLDKVESGAVDTCQMWIDGIYKIIGDKSDDDSIIQIPGDLTYIKNYTSFINHLVYLRGRVAESDFVIGDFEVTPQQSKYLIDVYGTYPLLYNWFPKIAQKIRVEYEIMRPRSEFFAAKIEFLEKILPYKRKFAYELTLAFLIHAISYNEKLNEEKIDKEKPWKLETVNLGTIGDYDLDRGIREAVDQIERTERLLKLLWREYNGGNSFNIQKFMERDKHSTAIREAALISFENFLRTSQE